jgi:uncharacterized protein (TIGR00251 family)
LLGQATLGLVKGQPKASITVRVIPRAKRNEMVGWLDDGTLKVRLTAPPVDGKANQALIKFMSETFDIQKADVEIRTGSTSRNKLLRLMGITKEGLRKKIAQQLGS